MLVSPLGRVTDSSDSQLENADLPISVIQEGSSKSARTIQPSKQLFGITVTPLGIVKLVSFSQEQKALEPKDVIPLGILIDSRL